MGTDGGRQAIVWTEPERAAVLRAMAERVKLQVVGAGCAIKGRSSAVAAVFDCPVIDDLRTALTEGACDLVVIGSAGDFGAAAEPGDAAAVLMAQQRGVRVVSLEPLPASALELARAWLTPGAGGQLAVNAASFIPLARTSRAFRECVDILAMFGQARTLHIEACCRPEEGSLGARLFSAVEILVWLMGEPESVDAAYAPPDRGPVIVLPGETLRDAHGDITVNFRFADGRAAAMLASDQSGRWSQTVTILGSSGRLRIYDDGFEWVNAEGERVDASRQTSRRGETLETPRSVEALASALERLLDPTIPDENPIDHTTVLAICQAILLSTRTGSAENPSTIRRMMEVG